MLLLAGSRRVKVCNININVVPTPPEFRSEKLCHIQKGESEMTKVYTPLAKATCLTRSTPFFVVADDDQLPFDSIPYDYEIHRIP
jgi:hypothetical protein